MPTIAEADVDAYLAAPIPLAFWRKHWGMTQVALSQAAGISSKIQMSSISRGGCEHIRQ